MTETPHPRDGRAAPVEPDGHHAEPPRGTLFLTLLYLIVVIGLWTYMYLRMAEGS
jgi:hypothetical protein